MVWGNSAHNVWILLVWWGLLASRLVGGHVAAWHKGMYCLNGTTPGPEDDLDTNDAVNPLFNLSRSDWWMHHVNKCDEFPPNEGNFLELPAGESFVVELAVNRAFTSLSYGGSRTNVFPDGEEHPRLGETQEGKSAEGCISLFNIHTMNESMAAGTAFAISYESDIARVTPENLVVFTVLYHTPWRRIAEYQVPMLPACPEGGCHCAWGWVADGCGEPNMYMQPFKCKVVGQTGSRALAPAVAPVWCEDDRSKCVTGPKQMVFWNQQEGSNVFVSGFDLSGRNRAPAYNNKMGFANGAQPDIFLEEGSAPPSYVEPGPSDTPVGYPGPEPTGTDTRTSDAISWRFGGTVWTHTTILFTCTLLSLAPIC
ncbi:hypothetical protein FA13DRAFT_1735368 [Coprinellus micaceus]|uniref:Uncharacterized protein n=1 Tax=Coprinellus micaceus TaxID=71717 RepID=A0A4Y7T4B1_COPMI|nr:hypothetical protein FA13DRAFT_1735368 [Coprinellus micaceus]